MSLRPRPTYTREQIKTRIAILWDTGCNSAEIAETLRIPEDQVERLRHELREEIRKRDQAVALACALARQSELGRRKFSEL